MKINCDSFSIDSLMRDEADSRVRLEIEQHIEHCRSCQQKLSLAAADDDWWTAAATHLSTVEQIQIPAPVRSQLADSGSFVLTEILGQRQSETVPQHRLEWQNILDPPTHPEMLGRIDQFEIEDKIGAGGMGIVLKGFDRHLNRAVAIKILAPHLASNGTSRKRFAREAQAAAAVVHPNVIPIYAVNSSETRPYIVMQLVSGHSLQSLVHEKGPLEIREMVRIAIQVAAGLGAAHQQGLIHRDIKPANILIEHDVSRVVITDFGLARAADDAGMTQTGWIAGTPHYMSPEQASGEDVDSRSDLFSLGGLMFFLATGREPFRGEKPFAVIQKILNEQPPSVQSLNSDVPAALSETIEKLLEKDPADRFASAAEVQTYLEHYLAHLQQPLRVAKPQRVLTARRRRHRNRLLASLFCGAITLTAVAVWVAIGRTTHSNDPTPTTTSNVVTPRLPLISNFVADESYFGELSEIDQRLTELETSLQSTGPFGPSDSLFKFNAPESLSNQLERLQSDAENYQRTQQSELERIKQLLKK